MEGDILIKDMKRFRRGFTLIEVVIVIAILAILASTLIPVISKGIDAYIMSSKNREEIGAARLALSRMIREIRQECRSISGADTASFSFRNSLGSNIGYIYENSLPIPGLKRMVNYGTEDRLLARDVVEFLAPKYLFKYYKQDGTQWVSGTDPISSIRQIEIRLAIKRATDSVPIVLQSRVTPRNLP